MLCTEPNWLGLSHILFILRMPISTPNSFLDNIKQTQPILYGPGEYLLFQEAYPNCLCPLSSHPFSVSTACATHLQLSMASPALSLGISLVLSGR